MLAAELLDPRRKPVGDLGVRGFVALHGELVPFGADWEAFEGAWLVPGAAPVAPSRRRAADDVRFGHRIVAAWQIERHRCGPSQLHRRGARRSVGDR